jgi:hypothetical protein
MPTIKERVGHTRYHGSRECGAPKVLLCFVHCWHAVGTAAAEAYLFCSFRKEECCSMHIDRKRIDGAGIAFVVITLSTVIALEILLSHLHAVF